MSLRYLNDVSADLLYLCINFYSYSASHPFPPFGWIKDGRR